MNAFLDLGLLLLIAAVTLYVFRGRQKPVSPPARPPIVRLAGPVGLEVAEAVATRLERGDVLAYGHRDYCGMGLRFADNEYVYDEVADGILPSSREMRDWSYVPGIRQRMVFANRTEFVVWLTEQTDESLNGDELKPEWLVGNQRLTLARLVAFANGVKTPTRA